MQRAEDRAALERIESAAARNLLDYVNAVRIVAPGLGAAVIGCAGGVAAFTGVGSPLTTVKGAGPEITDGDIDDAEGHFRRFGECRSVFELAPWITAETAARLARRGYQAMGSEDVVVRHPPFEAPVPGCHVEAVPAAAWPELMRGVWDAPGSAPWRALTEASALLPGAIHYGVPDDAGRWIACAQIMPAAGVGLFANEATLARARGRGAQTATIHARLGAAASRAFRLAAAEVAPGSTSERNYLRCGFHLCYARTHYVRNIDR